MLWNLFSLYIDNLHFSALAIVTKNPNSLSPSANAAIENFVNTFPDQEPGYQPSWFVQWISTMFGYNYKTTYSMSDLGNIQQSEAVCKWSQRP